LESPSVENEALIYPQSVTALFVIGGIVVGIFIDSTIVEVVNAQHWENPALLGVLSVSSLVSIVAGIATFFVLLRTRAATSFTDSVVSELRKVAWPTREETMNNTMIVIGATVFFSILLAVYDLAWAKLTGIFLYSGV